MNSDAWTLWSWALLIFVVGVIAVWLKAFINAITTSLRRALRARYKFSPNGGL